MVFTVISLLKIRQKLHINLLDRLYENITQHIPLSPADKAVIARTFATKRIARKEVLLFKDAPCRKLYFVADGLLRAFTPNEDGKEITVLFAKQNWWITDMNSFVQQAPATVTIEAVRDSTVFSTNYQCFNDLFTKIPRFNEFWRVLMQNAYCREQQRVVRILTMPAAQRYQLFLQRYPEVAATVTQRQIASYLGITPEFLSTLKADLKLP